ncbi:hypothetical protein HYC85_000736 [Camellia sinensis]|uniref:RING-type E3 ubiquitin transferase n=1 Tax=Camellia sinensis TaxID=4442 RepID=A0A7J7I4H7_CAMSI|nr:hypothetical protein HYC85_000736 [Camellia sinensis]
MDHRHFPNSSRMVTDRGHDGNHLTGEQSYIHMGRTAALENGSLHNFLLSGIQKPEPFHILLQISARKYHLSNQLFSGPSYVPFPQSSAAGNLYLAPQNNAGHAHSNYYGSCNIHENERGLLDSATGSVRGSFKRKGPAISEACERGSTGRFYGAGSSSSSSVLSLEKPPPDYQNVPSGHIGLPHYGGGSLSIAGEDPVRNVRSRSGLDWEANPMRTHSSSHSSHPYHSTIHSSSYRGAVGMTSMNVTDETTPEWNFNTLPPSAPGRIRTAGTNGLGHESNQFLERGSGTEISGCHPGSVSSRNLVSSLQYLPAPPIQGAREGYASHSQRAIPSYRAGPSYPQFGHEVASTENSLQSLSETYPSRYSRPSAGGWHNGPRNGRSRIAIDRFQSISSIVDSHDRIGSEDFMMMDPSSLYASSGNFSDQYGDMRLDIDDMSYERQRSIQIETMKKEPVVSVLEEYADGEEVGTMKNCGHNDFHVSCIRKWLLMKNSCPICKAPALTDGLKEE